MPKKYGYKQKQEQINLLAHNKILEFENFRYLLESLEEYIEKTGYYPNFKNKRQLRNITIPKEKKYSLDNCENLFRTKLLLFVTVLESGNTPDTTKKEIQEEFYKWISITGIDANNCPDEKLRHFLLEIDNVLVGNSEKIVEQARRYVEIVQDERKNQPINLKDAESALELFSSIQKPMNDKMEQAELYRDKNYFEVEIKDKFDGGSSEQGQQAFDRLTGSVSNDNFHFFRQKGQSIDPQQRTNTEIIQDVKNNPNS
jgi:hypothetical protein